ncbi:MAG: hypothetical protein H7Y37_06190 [Anaerolineae bacterium]|nr:hypothetical protein [Gloeobacterales cyanobacterium ES-bin-313]
MPTIWAIGPTLLSKILADSYISWGGAAACFETLPEHMPLPDEVFWLSVPPEGFSDSPQDLATTSLDLPIALKESQATRLTLPLVVTARGILYGEAIGQRGAIAWQPEPLSDPQRQLLYKAARKIVGSTVKPGVTLLHFAVSPEALLFKSLSPFPDESALVTLNSQQPDLFTCHWRCVLGLPIIDLQVRRPSAAYFQPSVPLSAQVRQAALLEADASLQLSGHLLQVQAASLCTAQEILHRIVD